MMCHLMKHHFKKPVLLGQDYLAVKIKNIQLNQIAQVGTHQNQTNHSLGIIVIYCT